MADSDASLDTAPQAAREPRWLTPDEQEAWKAVAGVMLLLPGVLDTQLQRDSGLSLFDYHVLSSLSAAEGRTLRMSELAVMASGSLSRLSNAVSRLEQRGWVRRSQDCADGRSTNATLTDTGWELLVQAAPGHVDAVRHFVLEPLTAAQIRTLQTTGQRILHQISASTGTRGRPAPRC
jgi:DNA-binding MarR family transcriptional regulator